ncbi:MAG: three-Cys-motif partner protein TcmP [Planctomycetes bacterium]|nr:three-Cys-motif partner protein TcmP [Planctomycetota bacterium]
MAGKKSRWNKLCKSVEADDGLYARESGFWAEEKLFFWNRYIEITTTAMVGHPAWPNGLAYVDLFAGPGVCFDRESKFRFPGSPLIAANAPKCFSKILLCDKDPRACDTCDARMKNSPSVGCYEIHRGDCNQEIDVIVEKIPDGALTLAFLDPTGLHLHFTTVRKLSNHGPVDLLILFPDAVDILRNADHLYFDQPDSNLDLVLGQTSDWRNRKQALGSSDGAKLRQLFADIYRDQLQANAGYNFFAEEVISGRTGPLYRLVYATKHERGLDFWEKSVKKELSGQKRLF